MKLLDGNGKPFGSDANDVEVTEVVTSEESRVKPRAVGSGATRGTQTVGYGKVKIDGSNDRIVIDDDDASLTVGDINDTDDSFGFAVNDDDGTELVRMGKTSEAAYGFSAYDDSIMRLHAGKFPDGSLKVKLSQIGTDVLTATDDQLIWSSDFNSFKIVDSGTADLDKAGGDVTAAVTISHSLGYAPLVIAFATQVGVAVQNPVPDIAFNPVTGLLAKQAGINVTDSNITFYLATPSWVGNSFYTDPLSYFFRWYMLQETAE